MCIRDSTDPEPIKAFFEEEQAAGINDDEAEGKDSETLAKDVIKELEYIGGLITTVSGFSYSSTNDFCNFLDNYGAQHLCRGTENSFAFFSLRTV